MSLNLNKDLIYPIIVICGPSGSGKSTSLRNLDPETTGIANIEKKQLPFKHAAKFINNRMLNSAGEVSSTLMEFAINPKLEVLVVESLSSYFDALMAAARASQKGYDIFNFYNKNIYELLTYAKSIKGKFVVFLATDEVLTMSLPEGGNQSVRRVKVSGKEHEGRIESHFVVCFFTESVKQTNGTMQYQFVTNTDGIHSAKSPMGMFPFAKIENDLQAALVSITKYYE